MAARFSVCLSMTLPPVYQRPDFSLLPGKHQVSAAGSVIDSILDVVRVTNLYTIDISTFDEVKYAERISECSVLVAAVTKRCEENVVTFVKTLVAVDEGQNSRHVHSEDEWQTLKEYCNGSWDANSPSERVMRTAPATSPPPPLACFGRQFFSTTNGRRGLGPSDVETGDIICVLHGGLSLFALRSVQDSSADAPRTQHTKQTAVPKGCFMLIGDAYIHGLMYGQAYEAPDQGANEHFMLV